MLLRQYTDTLLRYSRSLLYFYRIKRKSQIVLIHYQRIQSLAKKKKTNILMSICSRSFHRPFLSFLVFSIFLSFLNGSVDVGTEARQHVFQSYLERLKAIQQYYELLVIRQLASYEIVSHLGKIIIFTYYCRSVPKIKMSP